MSATVAELRAGPVERTIATVKALIAKGGVTRPTLENVLKSLQELAGKRELWTSPKYAPPEGTERQNRYLITEDPDRSYALYLNVMRPGKQIVPHNHTTWACIAAVEGAEYNYVYRRIDDGKTPGHAEIEEAKTVIVAPGTGIALMPDDIHAVEIKGDSVIRHLHLYGRALETLNERFSFDIAKQTCTQMVMSVQTKR
jgi:predicted metal-dependent enzyme (double-stranded beta helix superfamily)